MVAVAETFEPVGFFAGTTGVMAIAIIVIGVGLFVLGVLLIYWLIRLAVRHGTMDTARWQADGMPGRDSGRRDPDH